MRKTFALSADGRHPDRVLDAVKHEIRKYLKRERRRALPEGMDFWDFDCKAGADAAQAATVHVAELIAVVDAAAKAANPQVYVEILARPARRQWRPMPDAAADDGSGGAGQ
ncbi:DUF6172 family protein [Variovorax sp.]|uniref:DUF6172 family protein n=1 Tax=Variovorax sp. TaxID=1871043 RepID=UPI002D4C5428|nr:DUF6172 family protein [Variovorax sp.]HYP86368.1 DUF6172 family protein [Variovorax sp.]